MSRCETQVYLSVGGDIDQTRQSGPECPVKPLKLYRKLLMFIQFLSDSPVGPPTGERNTNKDRQMSLSTIGISDDVILCVPPPQWLPV